MFTKSIRGRFLLWLACLLTAVVGGFGFTAYRLHQINQLRSIDAELERRVNSIALDMRAPGFRLGGPFRGPPPEGPGGPGGRKGPPPMFHDGPPDFRGGPPPEMRELRLSPRTQAFFDESDTNGFYFAVWLPNKELLKKSTNTPPHAGLPERLGQLQMEFRTLNGIRELYHFTGIGHCILAGKPIADYVVATKRFGLTLLYYGLAVVAIGLGGSWLLTTRALRPIQDISAAATRISSGKLEERINVADTHSELGQLATLLNSTFARLEAAFAQQKQFTGDAAHELRTPLAVIISECQTTLARQRSSEEYRETLEACLETAQRMRSLSQSLLELARFDSGQELIKRESFDLADLARRSAEMIEPLAAQKNIALKTELTAVAASGDPERVSQVIINLLSNAVHYNNDGGEVRIRVYPGDAAAILEVEDNGHGIAQEDLPHIFERFYRADKSRSRSDGRSGLGLAITKSILDAHAARIEVQSELNKGTTFRVSLPTGAR